ncbi:hypothetical protein Glove_60g69 [Diversispora epigaea]|uniref:HMG box domain-containing protein n=1 Tax=Diversispora epigaea TaxID=1348612 RepID=A0A397JG62_9GLOM|nr:hypothetical protein Glove_60g69 [Diversispora epigaea]
MIEKIKTIARNFNRNTIHPPPPLNPSTISDSRKRNAYDIFLKNVVQELKRQNVTDKIIIRKVIEILWRNSSTNERMAYRILARNINLLLSHDKNGSIISNDVGITNRMKDEKNHQQQQEKNDQKRHQTNQRQPTFQHNNSTTALFSFREIIYKYLITTILTTNKTTIQSRILNFKTITTNKATKTSTTTTNRATMIQQQQIKPQRYQQQQQHGGIDPLIPAVGFVEQLLSLFKMASRIQGHNMKNISETIPIILFDRTNGLIQERNVSKKTGPYIIIPENLRELGLI